MTCKDFDANADFETDYEKVATVNDKPTTSRNEYSKDLPFAGQFVIIRKHSTSTEYLGISEVQVMVKG